MNNKHRSGVRYTGGFNRDLFSIYLFVCPSVCLSPSLPFYKRERAFKVPILVPLPPGSLPCSYGTASAPSMSMPELLFGYYAMITQQYVGVIREISVQFHGAVDPMTN